MAPVAVMRGPVTVQAGRISSATHHGESGGLVDPGPCLRGAAGSSSK